MVFGEGIIRGMIVTLRHMIGGYVYEAGKFPRLLRTDPDAVRQSAKDKGLFTVEYPEEKLAVPERFRFFPFLMSEDENSPPVCAACGICVKACPPQCIWLARGTKPDGKPKPEPDGIWIDMSICMNCGFCAEACSFNNIKMDHEYEISTYERQESMVYDMKKLTKTREYYAKTHPLAYAQEQAAKAAKATKAGP
jgi:NADH-quinone oxidoreductase subunit I